MSDGESAVAGHNHAGLAGQKYDQLVDYFSDFAEELRETSRVPCDLDYGVLTNVCESYAFDLSRYSKFHELNAPDRARRAAYICKWIIRLRPVYLIHDQLPDDKESKKFALMVNELFCLYVASGILGVDIEESATNRFVEILLYSLRYRLSSEDSLILLFSRMLDL